jgi:MoxR-like ATPase
MVIATQNPIEQQGTYPLPEAQLDRFLFKHILDYPSRDEERAIVARHGHRTVMPELASFGLEAVADAQALGAARRTIAALRLSDDLIDYIVDVVRATRGHESLEFGASPRSANMIATASRAYAAMQGRDYVIPDDVKFIALPALRHRVVLAPGAEIEGLQADAVLQQILEQVPAPR